MKLFELVGVKAHYDKDTNEIINLFQSDRKFTKMGQGVFSIVFANQSDVIYKFWLQDSEYEKFVEYSLKHQDNDFLPKFKSKVKTLTAFFKRPTEFPDKIKYIKMERLDTIDNALSYKKDSYYTIIKNIIKEAKRSKERLGDNVSPEDFIKDIRKNVLFFNSFRDKEDFDLFKEIYILIKDMLNNDIKLNDIHPGNIMVRNGKQPVITDPSVNIVDRRKMEQLINLMKNSSNLKISGK